MKHVFSTGVEQYRNRYRTYFKQFSVLFLSPFSQSCLLKLTIVLHILTFKITYQYKMFKNHVQDTITIVAILNYVNVYKQVCHSFFHQKEARTGSYSVRNNILEITTINQLIHIFQWSYNKVLCPSQISHPHHYSRWSSD